MPAVRMSEWFTPRVPARIPRKEGITNHEHATTL
jgi:hypothetical protein